MRGGGYLVGAAVAATWAGLLFRHLGVIDTGHYVTAMSLVAIVAALSDLGLTAVGIRELSIRTERERGTLARDLLGLRIVITIIGGAVVTGIAFCAYSKVLGAGVGLACMGLLLQAASDNYALGLIVGLRLGWVAALDLLRQLLTALVVLMLVVLGARLLPFLAVSIPVGVVILVCTARLIRGSRMLTPSFNWRHWQALLAPIIPYSLAVAAFAIDFRISVLLVSALSTGTQLGYFSAAFRVLEGLTVLPGILIGSVLPIFARAASEDHARFGYALGKVFEVTLMVGVWVGGSVVIGAPLAMHVIAGARFSGAGSVLAIQGIALGSMFVGVAWSSGLLSLGLYRVIFILNASALALDVILVTALAIPFGARGAAAATAVTGIVITISEVIAVSWGRRRLRPPLRIVPRVVAAGVVGMAPALLLSVPTTVRLCIWTIVFGFVLIATRAIPSELWEMIPRLRGRVSQESV